LEEDPLLGGGRRRRWWWALALALLAAAAAILLLLLLKSGGHEVTVPDVAGKSQAAALTTLRHAGLRPAVSPTANASVAVGTVIGTSPPHGASVQKGATVTVFVSTGPGSVALPDVTGQPKDKALETLRRDGFAPKPQSQASETVAKGTVISTDPSPGTEVQRGSPVAVLVSSGPASAKVPDVTGSSEADAKSALEAAGLKVAVQKREVEEPAPGTVVSQTPSAGTQVKQGSQVTIVVAQALAQIAVPNVVGQNEEEAIAKLSEQGFAAKTVSRTVTDPAKDGVVVQQSPVAGAKRKKGAAVTIAVGKLAQQTTSTPSPPTPTPPAAAPGSAAGSAE
jgi:serine/threonine-protein kinase